MHARRMRLAMCLLPALLLVLTRAKAVDAQIDNCVSVATNTQDSCYDQQQTIGGSNCPSGYRQVCNEQLQCKCCSPITTYTCNQCRLCYARSADGKLCNLINTCAPSSTLCANNRECINTAIAPQCFRCGDCPAGSAPNNGTGCTACAQGLWGVNCANTCACVAANSLSCNPDSGACACKQGWTGVTCASAVCGDGLVVGAEQCDLGNANGQALQCCTSNCTFVIATPAALNGSVSQCPTGSSSCDANVCSNGQCTHPRPEPPLCRCGNFVRDANEACDAGPNPSPLCTYPSEAGCQVCSANCTVVTGTAQRCGDGVFQSQHEQCDDGNNVNSDGCSSTCQVEPGYQCVPSGSGTTCIACPAGTWGVQCNATCGVCLQGTCRASTGLCTCSAPWVGATCAALPQASNLEVSDVALSCTTCGVNSFTALDMPRMTFSNPALATPYTRPIASSLTYVGFTPTGSSCATVLSPTVYTAANTTLAAPLRRVGTFSVCVSYNGGASFVLQTAANTQTLNPLMITVTIGAVPATAITGIAPSTLYQTTSPVVALTGTSIVLSSTTNIALSSSAACTSPGWIVSLPTTTDLAAVAGPQLTLATGATYYVCYSTNSGTTWIAQTGVTVAIVPPPASATAVQGISPTTVAAGSAPSMTLSGAVTLAGAGVAFAFVPFSSQLDCTAAGGRVAETTYTTSPATLAAPFTVGGTYAVCFLSGGIWQRQVTQGLVLTVTVPDASASSIASISPSSLVTAQTGVVTLTGAALYAGPSSVIAFVRNSGTCEAAAASAIVAKTKMSAGLTVTLTEPFMAAGAYALCFSTDGGATWFTQSGAATTLTVLPAPATSASISGVSPSSVYVGGDTFTFTSAVPSSSTFVALVASGASCMATASLVAARNLLASATVAMTDAALVAGTYTVCYSTDGGATYLGQTGTGVAVTVLAPPATNTTITAVAPSTFTATVAPTLTLTGLVPSSRTHGALARNPAASGPLTSSAGDPCAVSANLVSATLAASAGPLTLASAAGVAGNFVLCYSTDAAATYVGQLNVAVTIVPPPATGSTLTSIAPGVVNVGSAATFALVGVVPSPLTKFALLAGSAAGCALSSPGERLSTTTYSFTGAVASAALSSAGTYAVCLSTDGGTTWVGQTNSGVQVEAVAAPGTFSTITAVQLQNGVSPAGVLVMGDTSAVTFTGAVPSSRTVVLVTQNSTCTGSGISVPYPAAPTAFSGAASLAVAGTYFLCYSVDNGASYVPQQLTVWVQPPPAMATSLTLLLPSSVGIPVRTTTVTFQALGIVPSNVSFVGFVLAGGSCAAPAQFLAGKTYGVAAVSGSAVLGTFTADASVFTSLQQRSVCYSSRGGAGPFVLQTASNIATYPGPPLSTDVSITNGGTVLAGTPQTMTFVGGVLSPLSRIGFVPTSKGFCTASNIVNAQTYDALQLVVPAFSVVNRYYTCYSTDAGLTYVTQVTGFVFSVAPLAVAASISAITPQPIYVGLSTAVTAVGAIGSDSTYVQFVRGDDACFSGGAVTTEIIVNFGVNDDDIKLSGGLPSAGWWRVCYTTGGLDSDFVAQSLVGIFALPRPATATTIVSVAPPLVLTGTALSMTFPGATPSNSSWVAFMTSASCAPADLVSPTALTSSTVTVPAFTAAATYSVCYSTDGGATYVLQTGSGVQLTVQAESASGQSQLPLILGLAVGLGTAALIVLVVLVLLYRQRQHKIQLIKDLADPSNEVALHTQAAIFGSNPHFEPTPDQ